MNEFNNYYKRYIRKRPSNLFPWIAFMWLYMRTCGKKYFMTFDSYSFLFFRMSTSSLCWLHFQEVLYFQALYHSESTGDVAMMMTWYFSRKQFRNIRSRYSINLIWQSIQLGNNLCITYSRDISPECGILLWHFVTRHCQESYSCSRAFISFLFRKHFFTTSQLLLVHS